MMWITAKRIFRAGFLGFWRNGFVTLAAVLVMTVTLFVLGSLVFTGVILNSTLAELKEKVDMNVYFTTEAPEDRILDLRDDVAALPSVVAAEYVSRDEALARFRERHQNDQLTLQALEELGENPLGALLTIQARDTTQYESIARFINEHPAITAAPPILDKVNYFDERQRIAIDRLTRITQSAERIGLALLILLAFITVAITFNTIRLVIYTSRDEISVMRLVGADQMYVRAPFMVEGVLYGAVAGVATLLLFYPFTYWLGEATENFFGGVNVFSYYIEQFPLFFLMIVGSGILLGAISAFLAVRRYLTV
jgi:cell division transport system permease protein